MLKYVYIGNIRFPTYGLTVVLGVVICNCIALLISKYKKIEYRKYLFPAFCGAILAIIGAKVFGIIDVLLNGSGFIPLSKLLDTDGYSYFGGLAGFLLAFWLACKATSTDYSLLERHYLFLIPLLHVFWKLGCYAGGCCFGIPYNGPGAVIFPDGVNTLSGTSVFPIQPVEAAGALIIVIVMLAGSQSLVSPESTFLVMYGIERFTLEFFRYHSNMSLFSEGHVYSIICICIGIMIRINILKKYRSM